MDNPIAGTTPPLKPWHYAAAGGAVLLAIVAIPVVSHMMSHKTTPQLASEEVPTGQSRPWQPLVEPARPVQVRPAPPMPQSQTIPISSEIVVSKNNDVGGRATEGGGGGGSAQQATQRQEGELEARLTPTKLGGFSATRIKDLAFKILKGRIIPCDDISAIDTSYVGPITAVIPQDIRGSDKLGSVVLIDAGSTVFGTMERAMINGLDRQFALWQEITTPEGARVEVDSPAADELGRTGLDVDVNRHFLKKLEGAALISIANTGGQLVGSLANTALQSALNKNGSTNTNVNTYEFNNMGNQAGDTLSKGLIDIPDVGTRNQGRACSIFVARDLNFRSVYNLKVNR